MACQYKLHAEAVTEYADAYEWYEKRQTGHGEKYLLNLYNAIRQYNRLHRSDSNFPIGRN